MRGLFDINTGSAAIKAICNPLELLMSKKSIGHLLQTFHVLGYFILFAIAAILPPTRLYVVGIFIGLIAMFVLFGGCILTKTEMYYLEENVTTPGIVLDLLRIRPTDKDTDRFLQSVLSIGAMSIPIIVFGYLNSIDTINGVSNSVSNSVSSTIWSIV